MTKLVFKSGLHMDVKVMLRAESILIVKDGAGLFYIVNRTMLVKDVDD